MPRGLRVMWVVLALAALMAGVTAPGALAQEGGPILPQHSDPYWQAWYWNNTSFAGSPVLQRQEANINYDWGSGSPDARVNADNFSARWTRYIDVQPGRYRFSATSDDGMRVWIDSLLIINHWDDHAPQTWTSDVQLEAGHHLVVVEYYERAGGAVARLSWAAGGPDIKYWRGEYWNNTALDGTPTLARDDRDINFDWGEGSPVPGTISADYFSARWTRTLNLAAGNYRFAMTVDDGGRLWVNEHLLIDQWQVQSPRTFTGDIYLPGGPTTIKMEYFENTGRAVARLSWNSGSNPPPPPPPPPGDGLIVDDLGVGFVRGGSSTAWASAPEGFNGHLTWTRNNDRTRPNYNWARWYPSQAGLTAGRYEVYAYIPERYSTTGAANYWISHANGFTRRVISQAGNGGQWVSLGTYWFRGNHSDYVSLADVTGEAYLSRLIAFDAMKWVPR